MTDEFTYDGFTHKEDGRTCALIDGTWHHVLAAGEAQPCERDHGQARERLPQTELERLADVLVQTNYPYQVADVLCQIPHFGDLSLTVAAALARSVQKGSAEGREAKAAEVRSKLGL